MKKEKIASGWSLSCWGLLFIFISGFSVAAQESAVIGHYNKLFSTVLGGDVSFIEHLPEGYDKNKNTHPVVYMMNAQSVPDFANACATIDNLSSERIPDMILIGICNEGVASNYWACPDDSGRMITADKFNQFLEKELIPHINQNYRTNSYRILLGQSNSGLFALNSLIHHPDLFAAYVVASPMLGWCPEFQAEDMTRFLESGMFTNKKLYITYGELDYPEVLNNIGNFSKILEQKAPVTLQWKIESVINDGHVPYINLHDALLYFFAECTLTPVLQNSSVADIEAHYEKVSGEYGFRVNPKGDILMNVAWDLKEQKKFDRAIELFEYLVSIYPDNAMYLAIYGATLYKQGNLAGAREKANAALAIDPEQRQAKALMEKLNKSSQ
jgi:predicted alpha/beta superfamily hydrolase